MTPPPERQERLTQLRADLNDAGFTEGFEDDDLGAPSADHDTITVPTLPPDNRPEDLVCALCVRTMPPRRREWLWTSVGAGGDIPVRVAACGVCASQHNDPAEVDAWLRIPRADRRLHLAMMFGIDPATSAIVAPGTVQTTQWFEDDDGMPLAAVTHTATWSVLHPRCYFDVVQERTFE